MNVGEDGKGAVRAKGLDLLIGILDLPALAADSVRECERVSLGEGRLSRPSGLFSSLPNRPSEVSIRGRLLLGRPFSSSDRPSLGSWILPDILPARSGRPSRAPISSSSLFSISASLSRWTHLLVTIVSSPSCSSAGSC